MTEPSTTAAATLTAISVTLASLFTNIDSAVLVGATSGASLFVIQHKTVSPVLKLIYFFISLSLGYLVGPSLLLPWLKEPALASFVFSACCIGIATKLMSSTDQIDINKWISPR